MVAVELNTISFFQRLKRFYTLWKKNAKFQPIDAFVIAVGKLPDDEMYFKSTALQLYLLAYELPELIMVFTENEVIFHSTKKKISILQQIEENRSKSGEDIITSNLKFKYVEWNKKVDNTSNFDTIWADIKASKNGVCMYVCMYVCIYV